LGGPGLPDISLVQHTKTGKDPSKFTQVGIFGWKICHLATLGRTIVIKNDIDGVA
jgi:hypothetical protein